MSCGPWSHKWSKWAVIANGLIREPKSRLVGELDPVDQWIVSGAWERQRRECEICGKSQIREIRT